MIRARRNDGRVYNGTGEGVNMSRRIRAFMGLALLGAIGQPAVAQQVAQAGSTDADRAKADAAPARAESTAVAQVLYPAVRFEVPKDDGSRFAGLKWELGGAFATEFQSLSHENAAQPVLDASGNDVNRLGDIGGGFNLAGANLDLRVELAPGVHVNLTTYLSSRHHNEAWVKDGYLLMERSPIDWEPLDRIMEHVSLKVGHFEVNYGDAHFRRTDNGHAVANPFVENLILDAFTTEIGGEVYGRFGPFLAMGGVTSGQNKGDVTKPDERSYAFLAKLGVDYRLGSVLHARLMGSTYQNDDAGRATLFGGDRAGSRYFNVMDNAAGSAFTNGRVNPNFSETISAYQVNPFVKVGPVELFGVLEWAEGRTATETQDRSVDQYAIDAVYRLLDGRVYVGGRYNRVSGELFQAGSEQNIDRTVLAAGWFLNQYTLLKAEYVTQSYDGYAPTSILHDGRFDGLVLQAAVAF